MGIKNTVDLGGGVTLTDSYLKISNILLDKSGNIRFSFDAYKDKAFRDSNEGEVLKIDLDCYLNTESDFYKNNVESLVNSLKEQLYIHAKAGDYSSFSDEM